MITSFDRIFSGACENITNNIIGIEITTRSSLKLIRLSCSDPCPDNEDGNRVVSASVPDQLPGVDVTIYSNRNARSRLDEMNLTHGGDAGESGAVIIGIGPNTSSSSLIDPGKAESG